jgi:anti-anti-sigma factor
MSSPIATPRPASSDTPIEPADCHTARFATRWLRPSTAVVAAHGELDAANAHEFVDYALQNAAKTDYLVLDLTGIEFFGTAGFSALHTVNVRCASEQIEWAMAPSPAVTRLMHICDPDSALPMCDTVDAALEAVQGEPRRLLQLVPKSR